MSREAVADLVHRYADAVVHRDRDGWAATWSTDGTWSIRPGSHVTGRAAIVERWDSSMDHFVAVIQNVLNGTAETDADAGSGTGRWYVVEHWRLAGGEAGMLLGHYDDTYVVEDGRWCFSSRSLVTHYAGPADLSGSFLNAWG